MPAIGKNTYYTDADKHLLAVDCIIFGFDKRELKLLLFKRKLEPFKNQWSLIGSFVNASENLDHAASRVLEESTGLSKVYLEQLKCYGDAQRDPGGRVVSMAYYALIRLDEHEETVVENFQAGWFDLESMPDLILDHNEMVAEAFTKLQEKAAYQPIGFELLPEKFTLPQLRTLYEAIYRRPLDRRNFRKKILGMKILEKLEEKDKSTSRKGAYLYRFNREKYMDMLKRGFDFAM